MPTESLLVVLLLVETACLAALAVAMLRRSGGLSEDRALREILMNVEQDRTELAVLGERMEALKPLAQSVGHIRDGITEMQARVRAREDVERRTADAVQRLERVLSGTQSRGAAGEQMLDAVFRQLPADWQVRNLRVGNKVVEFGLRLPNGLILPIDSKWAATPLLEQLGRTDDPHSRQRIKSLLEATVLARTREVQKYIDPNLTVGFALAVVPDPVYDLCTGVQAEAFAGHVVLVGQGLFLPYLLLVFQTVLRDSQQIDIQRFDLYLTSCQQSITAMQEELEGRYSRAMTMLENSRRQIAGGLAGVQGELASLRRNAEVLAIVDAPAALAASQALAEPVLEPVFEAPDEDQEAR